jgi:excisionase family DNA binding protein
MEHLIANELLPVYQTKDTGEQGALPPTLDVIAVAEYLNISTWTVKNRIRSGTLRAYKQGNYWRIKREWLLEYESSLVGDQHAN